LPTYCQAIGRLLGDNSWEAAAGEIVKLLEWRGQAAVGDGKREASGLVDGQRAEGGNAGDGGEVWCQSVPLPLARAMVTSDVSVVTTLPYWSSILAMMEASVLPAVALAAVG